MSDIEDIRAKMNAVASKAEQMGGNLTRFVPQFDSSVREVEQRIGNTRSGADQAIIAILKRADEAVQQAASALRDAGLQAKEFAQAL